MLALNLPPASKSSPGNCPHIKGFMRMTAIGSRISLLVAGTALVVGSAFAQSPTAAPTQTAPLDPRAESTGPPQNLSKRLNQSNGN